MNKKNLFYCTVFILLSLTSTIFSQDEKPKVVGEVTVKAASPNTDLLYQKLRVGSTETNAFAADCATVNNLVWQKDRAVFLLRTGEVYFQTAVDGRRTGAVFLGDGEISLVPPTETEKKNLAIFTDAPELKEQFSQLVMFFTDRTFDEIKQSPNAQAATGCAQAARARDAFREKESLLKDSFHYNVTARTLADFYAPQRPGFFMTFIDGKRFGKLAFQIDPLGLPDVYPEQVSLISYGEANAGIWTAFHLADEYKKGTATSWQDRRVYDIKHHELDTTVDGTRILIRDEITLAMREANVRFLPFDLYRTLRVRNVLGESGEPLSFIQEDKDKDADFGVILPQAAAVGRDFKIVVQYDGTDALREAGSGNYILIPRSTWYPNNPASAFGDRASFDITFHYPKRYVMVGIGVPVGEEQTDGNLKTAKWSSEGVEMAVAGFNYGDFKKKEVKDPTTGYNLEVFVNRELPDEMKAVQQQVDMAERQGAVTGMTIGAMSTSQMADSVLVQAQNSTRIYNAFFGKLPYKRIAMTQQPAANFGQAWATLVFMPYTAFIGTTQRVQLFGVRGGTDGFWQEVAPHEVAHQWWGHIVGWTSYHDQWMSEGFAEFSASLYIQYIEKDINKFINFWEQQRKLIVEPSVAARGRRPYTVGPVTQGYRLNNAKTGSVARAMIYPKGAYILHMLRMMMYDRRGTGDERFQKMMRDFIQTNYNKDVSTEDFKRIVEKHITPEMDIDKNGKMDWFFDEWVYGTEMPAYKFNYQVTESNGKILLSGKITQSGVSDKFVMLVPIYLDFGKGFSYIGSATMAGNTSVDLKDIELPVKPQRAAIAAWNDVLAESVENKKQ
ncbi:MAG: hypothetical protein JSS81_24210 [Acidobacteria bacterium]|nr:hypothetical protein [Acidobacteriota bacterium]